MIVNALVSVLIAFRIFKVFQQVGLTSDEQNLDCIGGRKLYSIMSIIIESGMVLFSIQLARCVTGITYTADGAYAYQIIVPIHEIFNVIIRLVMSTYFY